MLKGTLLGIVLILARVGVLNSRQYGAIIKHITAHDGRGDAK